MRKSQENKSNNTGFNIDTNSNVTNNDMLLNSINNGQWVNDPDKIINSINITNSFPNLFDTFPNINANCQKNVFPLVAKNGSNDTIVMNNGSNNIINDDTIHHRNEDMGASKIYEEHHREQMQNADDTNKKKKSPFLNDQIRHNMNIAEMTKNKPMETCVYNIEHNKKPYNDEQYSLLNYENIGSQHPMIVSTNSNYSVTKPRYIPNPFYKISFKNSCTDTDGTIINNENEKRNEQITIIQNKDFNSYQNVLACKGNECAVDLPVYNRYVFDFTKSGEEILHPNNRNIYPKRDINIHHQNDLRMSQQNELNTLPQNGSNTFQHDEINVLHHNHNEVKQFFMNPNSYNNHIESSAIDSLSNRTNTNLNSWPNSFMLDTSNEYRDINQFSRISCASDNKCEFIAAANNGRYCARKNNTINSLATKSKQMQEATKFNKYIDDPIIQPNFNFVKEDTLFNNRNETDWSLLKNETGISERGNTHNGSKLNDKNDSNFYENKVYNDCNNMNPIENMHIYDNFHSDYPEDQLLKMNLRNMKKSHKSKMFKQPLTNKHVKEMNERHKYPSVKKLTNDNLSNRNQNNSSSMRGIDWNDQNKNIQEKVFCDNMFDDDNSSSFQNRQINNYNALDFHVNKKNSNKLEVNVSEKRHCSDIDKYIEGLKRECGAVDKINSEIRSTDNFEYEYANRNYESEPIQQKTDICEKKQFNNLFDTLVLNELSINKDFPQTTNDNNFFDEQSDAKKESYFFDIRTKKMLNALQEEETKLKQEILYTKKNKDKEQLMMRLLKIREDEDKINTLLNMMEMGENDRYNSKLMYDIIQKTKKENDENKMMVDLFKKDDKKEKNEMVTNTLQKEYSFKELHNYQSVCDLKNADKKNSSELSLIVNTNDENKTYDEFLEKKYLCNMYLQSLLNAWTTNEAYNVEQSEFPQQFIEFSKMPTISNNNVSNVQNFIKLNNANNMKEREEDVKENQLRLRELKGNNNIMDKYAKLKNYFLYLNYYMRSLRLLYEKVLNNRNVILKIAKEFLSVNEKHQYNNSETNKFEYFQKLLSILLPCPPKFPTAEILMYADKSTAERIHKLYVTLYVIYQKSNMKFSNVLLQMSSALKYANRMLCPGCLNKINKKSQCDEEEIEQNRQKEMEKNKLKYVRDNGSNLSETHIRKSTNNSLSFSFSNSKIEGNQKWENVNASELKKDEDSKNLMEKASVEGILKEMNTNEKHASNNNEKNKDLLEINNKLEYIMNFINNMSNMIVERNAKKGDYKESINDIINLEKYSADIVNKTDFANKGNTDACKKNNEKEKREECVQANKEIFSDKEVKANKHLKKETIEKISGIISEDVSENNPNYGNKKKKTKMDESKMNTNWNNKIVLYKMLEESDRQADSLDSTLEEKFIELLDSMKDELDDVFRNIFPIQKCEKYSAIGNHLSHVQNETKEKMLRNHTTSLVMDKEKDSLYSPSCSASNTSNISFLSKSRKQNKIAHDEITVASDNMLEWENRKSVEINKEKNLRNVLKNDYCDAEEEGINFSKYKEKENNLFTDKAMLELFFNLKNTNYFFQKVLLLSKNYYSDASEINANTTLDDASEHLNTNTKTVSDSEDCVEERNSTSLLPFKRESCNRFLIRSSGNFSTSDMNDEHNNDSGTTNNICAFPRGKEYRNVFQQRVCSNMGPIETTNNKNRTDISMEQFQNSIESYQMGNNWNSQHIFKQNEDSRNQNCSRKENYFNASSAFRDTSNQNNFQNINESAMLLRSNSLGTITNDEPPTLTMNNTRSDINKINQIVACNNYINNSNSDMMIKGVNSIANYSINNSTYDNSRYNNNQTNNNLVTRNFISLENQNEFKKSNSNNFNRNSIAISQDWNINEQLETVENTSYSRQNYTKGENSNYSYKNNMIVYEPTNVMNPLNCKINQMKPSITDRSSLAEQHIINSDAADFIQSSNLAIAEGGNCNIYMTNEYNKRNIDGNNWCDVNINETNRNVLTDLNSVINRNRNNIAINHENVISNEHSVTRGNTIHSGNVMNNNNNNNNNKNNIGINDYMIGKQLTNEQLIDNTIIHNKLSDRSLNSVYGTTVKNNYEIDYGSNNYGNICGITSATTHENGANKNTNMYNNINEYNQNSSDKKMMCIEDMNNNILSNMETNNNLVYNELINLQNQQIAMGNNFENGNKINNAGNYNSLNYNTVINNMRNGKHMNVNKMQDDLGTNRDSYDNRTMCQYVIEDANKAFHSNELRKVEADRNYQICYPSQNIIGNNWNVEMVQEGIEKTAVEHNEILYNEMRPLETGYNEIKKTETYNEALESTHDVTENSARFDQYVYAKNDDLNRWNNLENSPIANSAMGTNINEDMQNKTEESTEKKETATNMKCKSRKYVKNKRKYNFSNDEIMVNQKTTGKKPLSVKDKEEEKTNIKSIKRNPIAEQINAIGTNKTWKKTMQLSQACRNSNKGSQQGINSLTENSDKEDIENKNSKNFDNLMDITDKLIGKKYRGVSYDAYRNGWCTFVYKDGHRIKKFFSSAKYGDLLAKKKTIEWRLTNLNPNSYVYSISLEAEREFNQLLSNNDVSLVDKYVNELNACQQQMNEDFYTEESCLNMSAKNSNNENMLMESCDPVVEQQNDKQINNDVKSFSVLHEKSFEKSEEESEIEELTSKNNYKNFGTEEKTNYESVETEKIIKESEMNEEKKKKQDNNTCLNSSNNSNISILDNNHTNIIIEDNSFDKVRTYIANDVKTFNESKAPENILTQQKYHVRETEENKIEKDKNNNNNIITINNSFSSQDQNETENLSEKQSNEKKNQINEESENFFVKEAEKNEWKKKKMGEEQLRKKATDIFLHDSYYRCIADDDDQKTEENEEDISTEDKMQLDFIYNNVMLAVEEERKRELEERKKKEKEKEKETQKKQNNTNEKKNENKENETNKTSDIYSGNYQGGQGGNKTNENENSISTKNQQKEKINNFINENSFHEYEHIAKTKESTNPKKNKKVKQNDENKRETYEKQNMSNIANKKKNENVKNVEMQNDHQNYYSFQDAVSRCINQCELNSEEEKSIFIKLLKIKAGWIFLNLDIVGIAYHAYIRNNIKSFYKKWIETKNRINKKEAIYELRHIFESRVNKPWRRMVFPLNFISVFNYRITCMLKHCEAFSALKKKNVRKNLKNIRNKQEQDNENNEIDYDIETERKSGSSSRSGYIYKSMSRSNTETKSESANEAETETETENENEEEQKDRVQKKKRKNNFRSKFKRVEYCISMEAWTFMYIDITGKKRMKTFPIRKYGFAEGKILALLYRKQHIRNLLKMRKFLKLCLANSKNEFVENFDSYKTIYDYMNHFKKIEEFLMCYGKIIYLNEMKGLRSNAVDSDKQSAFTYIPYETHNKLSKKLEPMKLLFRARYYLSRKSRLIKFPPGIVYLSGYFLWVVLFFNKNNKEVILSFSVRKYGYEEAKKKCIECYYCLLHKYNFKPLFISGVIDMVLENEQESMSYNTNEYSTEGMVSLEYLFRYFAPSTYVIKDHCVYKKIEYDRRLHDLYCAMFPNEYLVLSDYQSYEWNESLLMNENRKKDEGYIYTVKAEEYFLRYERKLNPKAFDEEYNVIEEDITNDGTSSACSNVKKNKSGKSEQTLSKMESDSLSIKKKYDYLPNDICPNMYVTKENTFMENVNNNMKEANIYKNCRNSFTCFSDYETQQNTPNEYLKTENKAKIKAGNKEKDIRNQLFYQDKSRKTSNYRNNEHDSYRSESFVLTTENNNIGFTTVETWEKMQKLFYSLYNVEALYTVSQEKTPVANEENNIPNNERNKRRKLDDFIIPKENSLFLEDQQSASNTKTSQQNTDDNENQLNKHFVKNNKILKNLSNYKKQNEKLSIHYFNDDWRQNAFNTKENYIDDSSQNTEKIENINIEKYEEISEFMIPNFEEFICKTNITHFFDGNFQDIYLSKQYKELFYDELNDEEEKKKMTLFKQIDKKEEHFGIFLLINCMSLSDSAINNVDETDQICLKICELHFFRFVHNYILEWKCKKTFVHHCARLAKKFVKINGVRYDSSTNSWVVNFCYNRCRMEKKYFIRTHGFLKARQLAIEHRQQWLQQKQLRKAQQQKRKITQYANAKKMNINKSEN